MNIYNFDYLYNLKRGRIISCAYIVFLISLSYSRYYWLEFWLSIVGNGLSNVSGRSPNERLQLRLFTQSGKPSFETGRGANFTCVYRFFVLLIRVLTTKRREWTTKYHQMTTKRIVMITQICKVLLLGSWGSFPKWFSA